MVHNNKFISIGCKYPRILLSSNSTNQSQTDGAGIKYQIMSVIYDYANDSG